MAAERHFGSIPGVPVGTHFESRAALHAAGVHKPTQAGISGAASEGADSIVLSGGYEDDKDYGATIIYTGHGGKDPDTGKQVEDQRWTAGNQALRKSWTDGLPVRVVRGGELDTDYAPEDGYRYDGLYRVEDCWHEIGRSGFMICRFRLIHDDSESPVWCVPKSPSDLPVAPSPRTTTTIQRIVRNTAVSQSVKERHNFECQVCRAQLIGPAGPYAEGAHIKPLGAPHNGPDIAENVLCLCPTCHVLFDLGAFSIGPNLVVNDHCGTGFEGTKLKVVRDHDVATEYLRYHAKLYATSPFKND